ncbi:MAG TPA: RNA methyltransferase [Bryobacteraceae bacterium]|nr:RNA methyltransferase [Bryobacteraceae bacterium]
MAEGPHLLAEVQGSRWRVERVLHTEAGRVRFAKLLERVSAPVTELADRAFASISETESTQGILALVRPLAWTWSDLMSDQPLIVVLDGIQDPGNVGTIIRSAEAFGASGLVFAPGCARVSNGKVLRATAGSVFRIPFLEGILPNELLNRLAGVPAVLYGLSVDSGDWVQAANFRQPAALVVGSEGAGVSDDLARSARNIRIPTQGVESLNAAVACSIALFEAACQRNGWR